ncbi:MAG: hypothetical protein OEZ08_10585 [Betaproteobacteria bacterium]|nr:hypothetical protein [Betaproteobacteria bacterium]
MNANVMRILAVVSILAPYGCGGGGVEFNTTFPPINPVPVQNTNVVASEPFNFNLASTTRSRLVLTGINGSIVVNGAPAGSNVTVTGEREVGSDSLADAQAQLPLLQVNVQEVGADILVSTTQPQNSGGRRYTVNYRIQLPASFAVNIANVNGSVEVNAMAGNLDSSLINGRTEATVALPASGSVKLTGENGDIVLHLPQSTSAVLTAEVGIGTITLTGLVLQNQVTTSTLLQGTLGTGTGTVSLKTNIGSVSIDAVP